MFPAACDDIQLSRKKAIMKFLFFSLSSKGEEQNKGKVASVEKLIKF
jgi:hypothetical protein